MKRVSRTFDCTLAAVLCAAQSESTVAVAERGMLLRTNFGSVVPTVGLCLT